MREKDGIERKAKSPSIIELQGPLTSSQIFRYLSLGLQVPETISMTHETQQCHVGTSQAVAKSTISALPREGRSPDLIQDQLILLRALIAHK